MTTTRCDQSPLLCAWFRIHERKPVNPSKLQNTNVSRGKRNTSQLSSNRKKTVSGPSYPFVKCFPVLSVRVETPCEAVAEPVVRALVTRSRLHVGDV